MSLPTIILLSLAYALSGIGIMGLIARTGNRLRADCRIRIGIAASLWPALLLAIGAAVVLDWVRALWRKS